VARTMVRSGSKSAVGRGGGVDGRDAGSGVSGVTLPDISGVTSAAYSSNGSSRSSASGVTLRTTIISGEESPIDEKILA
jgi:hypothetical protein